MVNRGVLAQPYWWDEQWTISVQHTEADIDKHLAVFEEIAPRSRKRSRNAAWHLSVQQDISREHSIIQEKRHWRTRSSHRLRREKRRTCAGSWTVGPRSAFCRCCFQPQRRPIDRRQWRVTVWLWIISLILFFWPQGIAVIELAQRYPGEGGVYLWAKEVFGDFHGFLSGWCYWTNNMMYVPTIMLYFVGVFVLFWAAPCHARR